MSIYLENVSVLHLQTIFLHEDIKIFNSSPGLFEVWLPRLLQSCIYSAFRASYVQFGKKHEILKDLLTSLGLSEDHGIKYRFVCTHLNTIYMLNPNMAMKFCDLSTALDTRMERVKLDSYSNAKRFFIALSHAHFRFLGYEHH